MNKKNLRLTLTLIMVVTMSIAMISTAYAGKGNGKGKGNNKIKPSGGVSPISSINTFDVCPPLTIVKDPRCWEDENDVLFSNNAPYMVGQKYYWWIRIIVTANMDITDEVKVFDRLGGEFMIEGICTDWAKQPDLPGYPAPTPSPPFQEPAPFDFTFEYTGGTIPEPERDDIVTIKAPDTSTVATGTVNTAGVEITATFEDGDVDTFKIIWTGNSAKVHFSWTIGSMDEDEVKEMYLVISTDKNPAGHQEFTSPGITFLNSGATAKIMTQNRNDKWHSIFSTSTPPIPITVEE